MMKLCPKCGSRDVDEGRIYSAGAVSYRSDLQWHPFVGPNCRTWICMGCGYTESFVEAAYRQKIHQMRKKAAQKKVSGSD